MKKRLFNDIAAGLKDAISFAKQEKMWKCRYANEYKAHRAPKCNCEVCNAKWILEIDRRLCAAPDGTFVNRDTGRRYKTRGPR